MTDRLTPREDRAWRGFHHLRLALLGHLARELARDSGLTESDYAVLLALAEAPRRRMRARDLGQRLEWERSRVSHQIGRMEARGTVCREASPDDGRGFEAVLTEAGLAAIREATPQHLASVRHCFLDVLTPEQLDTLAEIADAVVAHLRDEHVGEDRGGGRAETRTRRGETRGDASGG